MKSYLLLIGCLFILGSCGGGNKSSSVSSVSQSQSSSFLSSVSSSSDASSSFQSSSSSVFSQAGNQYCDPHTVLLASYMANNIYVYDAEAGKCFGVKESTYQRKTVPLIVKDIDDENPTGPVDLKASPTVKISTIRGRNYFTFELTNDGVIPYCDLRVNVLRLLNEADEELLKISSTHVVGDTYRRVDSLGGVFYEEDCIAPKSTLTVYGLTALGSINYDDVAKVSVGFLGTGRHVSRWSYDRLPKLTPQELIWGTSKLNSNYPGLYVSFMNPLDYAIRLRDDAIRTIFFDEEGYVVGSLYVWLHDGLEKRNREDLTDADYVISAGGGLLLLADDMADIADGYTRSTAHKVMVFVDWIPEI